MASKKFGPRSKQERKLRSNKSASKVHTNHDSNEAEIVPAEAASAKAERRRQLQDELRAAQGQMSSKKKKRLDKYIENKLKKEESLDLLKKLAQQNSNVSGLQSSRSFGGGTKKRVPSRAGVAAADEILGDESNDGSNDESESESEPEPAPKPVPQSVKDQPVGSGLKRPLEKDASGAPIIRKRQRVSMPTRFQARGLEQLAGQGKPDRSTQADSTTDSGSNSDGDSEASWGGISDSGEGGGIDSRTSQDESDSGSDELSSDDDLGSDSDSDSDSGSESDEDDDNDDDGDDEEAEDLAASMFAALAKVRHSQQTNGSNGPQKRDVSGFKEWATQQFNEARDFAPSRALDDVATVQTAAEDQVAPIKYIPKPLEKEELPAELIVPAVSSDRKAHAVFVKRTPDIEEVRSKLPVVAEEQRIMEAIHNNPVTVVCGATGSGKTTQIPQFLFEAGYGDTSGPTPGMIAVTQPRRVAAVTMAQRVSKELGSSGDKVAYQIRYGSTVGKNSVIKFMTDGILIREIASDFKLTKYSAIVIDEAHERSVNTDILIGMLSRICELRSDDYRDDPVSNKPLKLVIMSATLMAKAFLDNSRLFRRGAPPLVQSEGRQYPVTMHFARRTKREYVDEAFQKIMRGHKKLPPGAMLVFLTGENEIITLSKRLREALGIGRQSASKVRISASEAPLETDDFESTGKWTDFNDEEEEMEDDSEAEEDEFDIEAEDKDARTIGALVLPLYSKLPTKEQLRIFEPPPEDTRLIVLATNVAETSITIPGVRYVFDCGRSKEKVYNQETGVQSFEIGWISKASATQRAGRAGRTGPGHCYRLYSSAIYERDFEDHTEPEILRMPVEGVVLQLKSMDLQHVANFPFPTPPDRQQILQAEKLLSYIGAVNSNGKVTNLGRDLSVYPISPRYAKMLAIGHQHGCMLLTIATVAALATPELFIPENQLELAGPDTASATTNGSYKNTSQMLEEEARERRRKDFNRARNLFSALDKFSDAIKLMAAFGAYSGAVQRGDPEGFCAQMFMRPKATKEAYQLFQQLSRIVADNHPGLIDESATSVPTPTPKQIAAMKKIVAVGFIDQVAIRADLLPSPPNLPKPKRASDVAYMTLFPSHDESLPVEERCVYVHASSVLAQRTVAEMPQYVVYSALQRGSSKVRLFPLTSVSEADLVALAKNTPLLEYGKPLGKVEPVPDQPNKRICWVVPSLVGKKGTTSWPLREQKVLQRRVKGAWEVEKFAD